VNWRTYGAVYVVDEKFRKSAMGPTGWMNTNRRTTFKKIITRAGLKPWPRLFQNLRASRETELIEKHPLQAVTDWIGNTPRVAMRQYLMTTDEHFDAAVKGDKPRCEVVTDQSVEQAAQNPAQQAHAECRGDSHEQSSAHKKPRRLPGSASKSEMPQLLGLAGTGFEPATSRL
jgi:hypothetical protein